MLRMKAAAWSGGINDMSVAMQEFSPDTKWANATMATDGERKRARLDGRARHCRDGERLTAIRGRGRRPGALCLAIQAS